VEFPYATECCGAYQVVNNRDIVTERTATILSSAIKSGAEAIVVSCPLCEYNLRQTQKQGGVNPLPTLYFTQLMALAFGLDPAVCGFEENSQETRNWLKSKRLIS
jgi:heterodisulfide reductase subunit B